MKQTSTPELVSQAVMRDPVPGEKPVTQVPSDQLDPPPLAASAPDGLNDPDDDRRYALHWGINE